MSDQPTGQDTIMSENKAGKQPVQEATSASNQQDQQNTSHGRHKHDDNATQQHEAQTTRGPAYPLINWDENLEGQFGRTYHMMLDYIEQGDPEEAEQVAHILLSWGNVPVLYRAYAHMVLAHGLHDCLLHAEKAVEEAEWGLNKYGDDKGVGSGLLATTKRILAEVKARPVEVDDVDEDEEEKEDEEMEKDKQEAPQPSTQEQTQKAQQGPAGQQPPATSSAEQPEASHDEMLFDQFEAERSDDEMLLDQPVLDTVAPVSQAPEGANIGAGLQPEAAPKVSFTSEVSRTTSGNTTGPSRTTSDITTAPSRTTSSNTTVPSRTTSANVTANTESKRVDKRDRSESSNDEGKPPLKKANTEQTHSDNEK